MASAFVPSQKKARHPRGRGPRASQRRSRHQGQRREAGSNLTGAASATSSSASNREQNRVCPKASKSQQRPLARQRGEIRAVPRSNSP